MYFALQFLRLPKKFKKVLFVLACFQASAVPRPENSDSDEKDALFGLDTQISAVLSNINGSN
jgi:hypothetical protein